MPTEYRFNPADHGIFVEIYLPKKAAFQGTLYQALTEGFDMDAVREHLTTRKADVERFFGDSAYTEGYDERVRTLRQVFTGYSMYEVDGVDFEGKGQPIAEERTQVIRITFLPEVQAETPDLPEKTRQAVIREYIRLSADKQDFLEHFLAAHPEAARDQVEALVADLRDWEAEVALFLFGYIVFNLCERIRKLGKEHEQAELWVTSFWNLAVNAITKVSVSGH